MTKKKCIGVFDSGFGGLTILRGIVKELPQYDYVYLGDTARVPYGTRSQETIYEFTKQAVDFLFGHDCELIILACNTASSDALRTIQREYLPKYYRDKRVLGVLIPAAEYASVKTKNKRIGVIATPRTVESKAFVRELHKLDAKIKVFQKACPLLVPLVEAGEYRSEVARTVLKNYLKPLLRKNVDTLILGCTHYGILEPQVRKIVGSKVNIVSEAGVVSKSLTRYLERHRDTASKLGRHSDVCFYSTDLTEKFMQLGGTFFGKKIKARHARLV